MMFMGKWEILPLKTKCLPVLYRGPTPLKLVH